MVVFRGDTDVHKMDFRMFYVHQKPDLCTKHSFFGKNVQSGKQDNSYIPFSDIICLIDYQGIRGVYYDYSV